MRRYRTTRSPRSPRSIRRIASRQSSPVSSIDSESRRSKPSRLHHDHHSLVLTTDTLGTARRSASDRGPGQGSTPTRSVVWWLTGDGWIPLASQRDAPDPGSPMSRRSLLSLIRWPTSGASPSFLPCRSGAPRSTDEQSGLDSGEPKPLQSDYGEARGGSPAGPVRRRDRHGELSRERRRQLRGQANLSLPPPRPQAVRRPPRIRSDPPVGRLEEMLPVVRPIVFPVVGPTSYSAGFGDCRDGCTRLHEGIDILTDGWKGFPVIAAHNGVVTRINFDGEKSPGAPSQSPMPRDGRPATCISTRTSQERIPNRSLFRTRNRTGSAGPRWHHRGMGRGHRER